MYVRVCKMGRMCEVCSVRGILVYSVILRAPATPQEVLV